MTSQGSSSTLARLRLGLRVVLGGASLVFVVYALRGLVGRWDSSQVSLSWGFLLLSTLPLALGVVVLALSWKWLLEGMTARSIPTPTAVALHFESQLARYTPGKVGVPLVRMAGAPDLGVSAGAVGSSVVLELLPYLSVGAGMGFLCLFVASRQVGGAFEAIGRFGVVGLGVFTVITLVLVLLDRRHYPAAARRLLRVEGQGPLVPARVPAAHAAYWFTWALHGYLTSLAVGAGQGAAFASAGVYVVAPVAGFLALITPAGVGVREAVASVALAPVLGPSAAIAAAIVSRLTSLVVDVLAWAIGRVHARRMKRSLPAARAREP
jgi:uncharacterized membrane protein YbhN (UPF0104 family)